MSSDRSQHATRLLQSAVTGDSTADEELIPVVYDELREIAGRLLRGERDSLQPTELVHEAYVRLVPNARSGWEGEVHFRRLAARAMRFVLVDRARARLSDKKGAGRRPVTLDEDLAGMADQAESVLFVHEGLEALHRVDDQLAEIVELKFFGGLTIPEIATCLGSSPRTVDRGWRVARAWWLAEYTQEDAP